MSTDHHAPRTRGDQRWQNLAACASTPHRTVDAEIFFPEPDEMDRIRAAKALCGQCPVRRTCLDAALENGDRTGIRGGMTEEERDPLHRNLASRLDYARINTVLAGRDIHLTDAERQALARIAYRDGIPAKRLAWLLKITEDHAVKLYRTAKREIRNRSVNQVPQRRTNPTSKRPGPNDLGTAA
jgi:WhiB family redox-sensing transcriptional regulator